MKKWTLLFWISTGLLFVFQGVMPALTGHTEMAKEGTRHLGYPDYFGTLLTLAKIAGAIVLILPITPPRLKEWAYAGFFFDFTAAFISLWVVDGAGPLLLMPLIVLAVWLVSYISYHRLLAAKK